jgi:hypothetical protein
MQKAETRSALERIAAVPAGGSMGGRGRLAGFSPGMTGIARCPPRIIGGAQRVYRADSLVFPIDHPDGTDGSRAERDLQCNSTTTGTWSEGCG